MDKFTDTAERRVLASTPALELRLPKLALERDTGTFSSPDLYGPIRFSRRA